MDTSDGVAHLQAAAREMVAAARSFLDAVEEVVNDENRLTSVVTSVTDAMKGAADAVGDLGSKVTADRPSRVEHIDIDES
jgi:hypothetical protein